MKQYDVIVIGGGQSGLSVGFYLRRTDLNYIILDQEENPGGAWQHTWESLRLFSPARWSSLPGKIMSGGPDYYPTKDETIEYLQEYEDQFDIQVKRPVKVYSVQKDGDIFSLNTSDGEYQSRAIVSATGTYRNPHIPQVKGLDTFKGEVIHSSQYRSPEPYKGKRVAIVGGGNSGAQILAEVSKVTDTLWVTKEEPDFLADDIDGRYLFDVATKMYEARKKGESFEPPSLGDIVMVEPVKDARERGVLKSISPSFQEVKDDHLVWENGRKEKVDVIIFCTGFKPALDYLNDLNIKNESGRIPTKGTQAIPIEGVWLVGYGNWTGFASATLVGVGRSSRKTVKEISEYLKTIYNHS